MKIFFVVKNQEKVYSPENLPIELYPEWPSNETDLENLLKPLIPENNEKNEIEKYIDPNNSKVLLPIPLFVDYLNMSIKWSPPEKYIIEFYLDKLIQKQMPKKNSYKFRLKIHESYQEELKIRKKKLEEANEENELNENKKPEIEKVEIQRKKEEIIEKKPKPIINSVYDRNNYKNENNNNIINLEDNNKDENIIITNEIKTKMNHKPQIENPIPDSQNQKASDIIKQSLGENKINENNNNNNINDDEENNKGKRTKRKRAKRKRRNSAEFE